MNKNRIPELAKTFSTACKDVAKKSEVKGVVYIAPIVLAATMADTKAGSWANNSELTQGQV